MITYIMLTWERKKFVEEFFKNFYESVSNPDFAFFITDNGSKDGTAEFLEKISSQDKRIFVTLNKDNKGLQEYKNLLKKALNYGNSYIVILDDDVLAFPHNFDAKMVKVMEVYQDVGMLALDVVQDEKTNGAKPTADHYIEEIRNGIRVEWGPAGGWCTMLRKNDFKKIHRLVNLIKLNMATGEDATIGWFFRNLLRKKPAVLAGEKCLHATGPFYSKKYGYLERDIEKYKMAGLKDLQKIYEDYRDL